MVVCGMCEVVVVFLDGLSWELFGVGFFEGVYRL